MKIYRYYCKQKKKPMSCFKRLDARYLHVHFIFHSTYFHKSRQTQAARKETLSGSARESKSRFPQTHRVLHNLKMHLFRGQLCFSFKAMLRLKLLQNDPDTARNHFTTSINLIQTIPKNRHLF